MKNVRIIFLFIMIALVSCQTDGVEEKKAQLMKYKDELQDLKSRISTLEKELVELDPDYAKEKDNSTLVSVIKLQEEQFAHYIDVRGTVESRKNITLSAETMGKVSQILVKEGDFVKFGQTLLIMEADVIRRNIDELKTSLELAETVYEKQANLWDKNIGTEVQYLQAKNNKESLERRLATAYSQLNQSVIKAPFAGTIDKVIIKTGEMASMGMPLIRIVSLNDMYVHADVSESFIGRFNKKDSVSITFPSLNKQVSSEIYSLSQVIDQQNRTYSVEVSLPFDNLFRPNQLGILRLKDYENPKALVIPSEIVQKDSQGDYIYVAVKADGKLIAKKKHIKRGVSFNNRTEVLDGLKADDVIIMKGYRNISDNVAIKIVG